MSLAIVKHCSDKHPNISSGILIKYALLSVHSWYLHRITHTFTILSLPLLMWQVADELCRLLYSSTKHGIGIPGCIKSAIDMWREAGVWEMKQRF